MPGRRFPGPRSALLGAADNPILMDENGRFVESFSPPKRSPSGRVLLINRGPPSIINAVPFLSNPTPPPQVHNHRQSRYIRILQEESSVSTTSSSTSTSVTSSSASSLSSTVTRAGATARAARAAHRARAPLAPRTAPQPEPPSLARTRVRPWSVTLLRRNGSRASRDDDLLEAELYIGATRPPPSPEDHIHECGICLSIQSHPVVAECGHSHCYVLDHEARHQQEEGARIAADYPDWHDLSEVTYSWAGLKFPQPSIWPTSP
ncbi:hypothetical protein C8R46DRAFT_1238474 [Mycena filopes]|nr:hypothetical protein C8R46DRAFT_1238474 [Mycena filopes]